MIRYILCQGVGGFTAGSVKYLPTLGFTSSSSPPVVTQRRRRFLTLRVGR
jgi:hypothetical protein